MSALALSLALLFLFSRTAAQGQVQADIVPSPPAGSEDGEAEAAHNPQHMGSSYVALDSWIYPAMERLAGLGYLPSAYLGMRPWTRMECARLLQEAGERMEQAEDSGGESLYRELAAEYAAELRRRAGAGNRGLSLDSVYVRAGAISGSALSDGYHFAQTLVNDYGRPYGEGFNLIAGMSGYAVAGPAALSVRAEYQRAPRKPATGAAVWQAIANADFTRPVPDERAAVSRVRVIDSLATLNLRGVQLSFGKQSLWLGPGEAGPLLFSNNAESIVMLKLDTVSPYALPIFSRFLGPVRTQFFLGRLSGHRFEFAAPDLLGPGNINPQPYLHGTKISFKPTPNLELGMGMTAQFAGPGLPFTWGNFLRTFYSHTGDNNNPGKRLSGFDFTYRVPGLRRWLTLYNDALAVDEYSPIGSSRPTLNPGVYLPQLPGLAKVELRAEYLRSATSDAFAPGFVYFHLRRFRSGYTNNGNLLASWIGRAGEGGQAWLTYWRSARTRAQLGYRHQEVRRDFLGGGRVNDYRLSGDVQLRPGLVLSGLLQWESWKFPLLSSHRQSNFTSQVQLPSLPRAAKDIREHSAAQTGAGTHRTAFDLAGPGVRRPPPHR